jgi:hypothetical protein
MRRIGQMMIQKLPPQAFQPVDVSSREDIDHIAHGGERSLMSLTATPAQALCGADKPAN